jgi:hypothetical protein
MAANPGSRRHQCLVGAWFADVRQSALASF